MIFDDFDFSILKEFAKLRENQETSTWTITKKIFLNARGYEQKTRHIFIKRRIQRLNPLIISIKNGENKLSYILVKDNVRLGKHKFPNGYKNALMIFIDGKWCAYQI